ncbi:unnamed protein product [Pleuronectes platessa]|uniref:Uncharacterized protein n=1 Tax=Pleuronectes platessa TaxID=8262 RepID=A0A9N7YWG9_PLEPL|nr:unnamed protein product [Pleuronectes platessa]
MHSWDYYVDLPGTGPGGEMNQGFTCNMGDPNDHKETLSSWKDEHYDDKKMQNDHKEAQAPIHFIPGSKESRSAALPGVAHDSKIAGCGKVRISIRLAAPTFKGEVPAFLNL